MPLCHSLHYLHRKLVMINRHVGSIKDRSQFMLAGSHFVMLCLGRNSQFPQFPVQLMHICRNPCAEISEIVIVHLLTFRCRCSEKSSSGKDQILSLLVILKIDKEVFLLRPDCCKHICNFRFAKKVKHLHRFTAYGIH